MNRLKPWALDYLARFLHKLRRPLVRLIEKVEDAGYVAQLRKCPRCRSHLLGYGVTDDGRRELLCSQCLYYWTDPPEMKDATDPQWERSGQVVK